MLDNFKYGYYHGTNRLWHTAADEGDNYQYDPIGNLISDAKEGVQIDWNPYGKVRRVDKNGGNATHFRYDAAGNRIAKIADNDSTVYVRDASGNVMAVYRNGTLAEQSIYGSSRLGLHLQAAKPGYRTLGHKQYELSNHLGNVLATVRDRIQLSSDSTWAQVSSISDYYPFGLAMEGRSLQDSSYRYGFNGKENDNSGEWGSKNHYDYGFRIYNPAIAKFLSVDPLTKSYPMLTPYQFASNRPIDGIDLDGLEFYKSTYFDLNLQPKLSLVHNKTVQLLTIQADLIRMRDGGIITAIKNKSTSSSNKPGYDEVDKLVDLALEFKDLGISSSSTLGKVLTGISRSKSIVGIAGEFISAYEKGKSQGQDVGFTMAVNLLERDIKRAEWVSSVIVNAHANGIISGDVGYLTKLANFALDDQKPLKSDDVTGLGVIDNEVFEQIKSDFQKLENYVEDDKNIFLKVEDQRNLDRYINTPEYIQIKNRKLDEKPK